MEEAIHRAENILENVLSNPELLSGILSMAGKLSAGLNLFSSKEAPAEEKAPLPPPAKQSEVRDESIKEPSRMQKHQKLIEALMLYVEDDKRQKLELMLKLLDVLAFAGTLRG